MHIDDRHTQYNNCYIIYIYIPIYYNNNINLDGGSGIISLCRNVFRFHVIPCKCPPFAGRSVIIIMYIFVYLSIVTDDVRFRDTYIYI